MHTLKNPAARRIWSKEIGEAVPVQHGNIEVLESHAKEIDDAQELLRTLPDRISYDIMVPFGRVAMFPGQLKHTNEVTMALGDGVHIQTSAKHAQSVLQRRRQYVAQQMDVVRAELAALQTRSELAPGDAETEDGVREITEEYDEALHGPVDAPMVPPAATAHRQRFGPPRNAQEAALQQRELDSLRAFAAEHAQDEADKSHAGARGTDAEAGVVQLQDILATGAERAAVPVPGTVRQHDPFSDAPDSDDEDQPGIDRSEPSGRAHGVPPALAASDGAASAGMVNEMALAAELARLGAAFDDDAETDAPVEASRLVQPLDTPAAQTTANVRRSAPQAPAEEGAKPQQDREHSRAPPLKRGFLGSREKQPVKGILKKQSASTSATYSEEQAEAPVGPRVSQALAHKLGPTQAERDAFSGRVLERPVARAAPGNAAAEQGGAAAAPVPGKDLHQTTEMARLTAHDMLQHEEAGATASAEAPPQRKVSRFKAKMLEADGRKQ